MGRRDSGSKPAVNSRVPFIFTEQPSGSGSKRKMLQADRIEHPDFIRANGIKPDLYYYLDTQVAGYSKQILGVMVERLPNYNRPDGYWENLEAEMRRALGSTGATEEQVEARVRTKIDTQRQELAKELVFGRVLGAMRLKRDRQRVITSFFGK